MLDPGKQNLKVSRGKKLLIFRGSLYSFEYYPSSTFQMKPQTISKNLTTMTVQPIDDSVVESRTDDSSTGRSRPHTKTEKRTTASPTKVQAHHGSVRGSPRKRMHRRNRYIIAASASTVFAPSNCEKQVRRRRNHALTSNEYERIFYANGLVLASI